MALLKNAEIESSNIIREVIIGAITAETKKLIVNAKKNIESELDRRTPEIIAGIIVEFMKQADFQVLQDRIIFTIKRAQYAQIQS